MKNTLAGQNRAFLILFAVVFLFTGYLWLPFLPLLAVSAILSVLMHPVFKFLVRRTKRPWLAALITTLGTLAVLVVPLYFLGQSTTKEIIGLAQDNSSSFGRAELINRLPETWRPFATTAASNIAARVSGLAGEAFSAASSVVSNVASFLFSLFLVFFSLYYLLKDGEQIVALVEDLLPLPPEAEVVIFKKLHDAVRGVVLGTFLVAIAQGLLSVAGFVIFSMPQPLLWGAFATFASLIPNVGTGLTFIPAILYLLLTGHTAPAIGLLVWWLVLVSNIDNILRPQLVGRGANLHPLLVFFGVLGGLQTFGFIGLLIGPIIVSVLVTLVEIYRKDFLT